MFVFGSTKRFLTPFPPPVMDSFEAKCSRHRFAGKQVWVALVFALIPALPGVSAAAAESYTHDSAVRSAALSPDGKHLATVCLDGSVHLWQTRDHSQILLHPSNREPQSFAVRFAPNSQLLCMFRFGDLSVRIWKLNANRWEEVKTVTFGAPGARGYAVFTFNHSSRALYAGFAPVSPPLPSEEENDNRAIAPTTIVKIDITSPQCSWKSLPVRRKVLGFDLLMLNLAVSTDEKTLFMSMWDKILSFDIETGQEQQTLHVKGMSSIKFSPDGACLFTASTCNVLMSEWDIETTSRIWAKRESRLVQLKGPRIVKGAFGAAFTPDSQHVVIADKENGLRVVRIFDDRIVRTVAQARLARQLVFADRHTLRAVGYDCPEGKSVFVWTIEGWESNTAETHNHR